MLISYNSVYIGAYVKGTKSALSGRVKTVFIKLETEGVIESEVNDI